MIYSKLIFFLIGIVFVATAHADRLSTSFAIDMIQANSQDEAFRQGFSIMSQRLTSYPVEIGEDSHFDLSMLESYQQSSPGEWHLIFDPKVLLPQLKHPIWLTYTRPSIPLFIILEMPNGRYVLAREGWVRWSGSNKLSPMVPQSSPVFPRSTADGLDFWLPSMSWWQEHHPLIALHQWLQQRKSSDLNRQPRYWIVIHERAAQQQDGNQSAQLTWQWDADWQQLTKISPSSALHQINHQSSLNELLAQLDSQIETELFQLFAEPWSMTTNVIMEVQGLADFNQYQQLEAYLQKNPMIISVKLLRLDPQAASLAIRFHGDERAYWFYLKNDPVWDHIHSDGLGHHHWYALWRG